MVLARDRLWTIEDFVGSHGLLRQFPKQTWKAAAAWLGPFCDAWNLRREPKETPWKAWGTEWKYDISALMAWVDYELHKPKQINLVPRKEEG